MKCETITGPAHWASALINGDYSDLTTEECAQVAAWLKREGITSICGIADNSERFTWSLRLYAPECNASGGNVCNYQYLTA